jgi:hypothetical protein
MSRKGYPQYSSAKERASQTNTYTGGGTEEFNFDHDYASMEADRVGANTPGWPHNKVENNYFAYKVEGKWSAASQRGDFVFPSVPGTYSGTYPTSLLSSNFDILHGFENPGILGRARDRAIAELQKRAKNQKINLGVAAAEFKKTCNTVADTVRRLASAYGAVKRGNIGGALGVLGGGGQRRGGGGGGSGGGDRGGRRRGPLQGVPPNSGDAAKDWLSIQYGWKPLLSDVFGGLEEMANTLNFTPPKNKVTSGIIGEWDDLSFVIPAIASHCPPCRAERKLHVTLKGAIEYEVGSEGLQFLTRTGVMNPLAVAWELVPYSFVVDWFLPVGSYLNNLDYNHGLVFKRGWLTTKVEGSWKVRPIPGTYVNPAGFVSTWSGGAGDSNVKYFAREILAGFPPVHFPPFKDPISLKHATNALALLRTAFGR